MSFLNDQKRARRGAKTLLRLILEKENFEKNLEDYTASDGIIDADFLKKLDEARLLTNEIDGPEFVSRLEAQPINFKEAILEHLIQSERYPMLIVIRDSCKDKSLKKSVKQHIHVLNTQGVKIESRVPKTWTLDPRNEKAEAINLISDYDPRGERILIYSIGLADGLKVLQVIESDIGGIKDFNYFKLSRTKAKTYATDISADLSQMDISPGKAYWFITRALKRNESSGLKTPSGFITALSNIAKPKDVPDRHPFFDVVRPVDLEHPEASIGNSDNIFNHRLAQHWTIDPSTWKEFQYELYKIAPSEQSLANPQVQNDVKYLVADFIEKYCAPPNRSALAQRLLDMAWICTLNDERDMALLTYATSQILSEGDLSVKEIPFCQALLSRFFPSTMSDKENSAPKIIVP